jgi:RimJ/RimL family protein N-acetyltransferase
MNRLPTAAGSRLYRPAPACENRRDQRVSQEDHDGQEGEEPEEAQADEDKGRREQGEVAGPGSLGGPTLRSDRLESRPPGVDPPDPPLGDGVVSLRPADERDLAAIESGITDPEVIRWFGHPKLSAREVLDLNRGRWLDGSGPTFAICGADDRCLGHVWINVDSDATGAVGYWLLPEARGRGLATRSVRLVCDWGFRDVGLRELRLLTEPENLASQRVAERAGFRRHGQPPSKADRGGSRGERVVYSLTADDPRRMTR